MKAENTSFIANNSYIQNIVMKTLNIVKTKFGLKINVQTQMSEKGLIKGLPWESTKRAWSPENKCWQVNADISTLEMLKTIRCKITPEIEKQIKGEVKEKIKKLEASKATDANVEIPSPEGLKYLPYQKAGIVYAIKNQNTLIADEMGLGKTIQALGVINFDKKIKRVVIVCPASLKLNWRIESEKWLVRPMKVQIIGTDDNVTGDVIIINYDILHKFVQIKTKIEGKFVMKGEDILPEFDLLIADESHYVKSSSTRRTKALQAAAKKSERKILLTGTPIKNRTNELFTQINLLRPDIFGSFWRFAHKYCDAKHNGYGWDFSGSSNIDELYTELRSTCMVRRLKKDVLTELPPKIRQVIELPANGSASKVKAETKLATQLQNRIEELRVAVELAKASDDEEYYKEAVRQLRVGQVAAFTEMAKIRKEIALSKLPYVINHIEDSIEDGEKVIVFAHHTEVCAEIYAAFKGQAVVLTGSNSSEQRQKAVNDFQNNPNIKVFVGSLHAAGTGITLTASSRVIFAELDWTPAIMQQAEDRAHRIGQHNNVLIQYLIVEGSIESKIANDIARKLDVIELALDKGDSSNLGKVDTSEIEKMKAEVSDFVDEFTTKAIKREKLEKEAKLLNPEQIKEIHDKLKDLAQMCDGAASYDGSGFNKIDTGIGKSLAYSESLSSKQAALGAKIVRKYHKQVGELSF